MLEITVRDFNEEVIMDRIITNPNPINSDNKDSETVDTNNIFNDDGVFSSSIFGSLSNSQDWSCLKGCTVGEYNKHTNCTECGTEIKFKGLMIEKEGFIDLAYPLIHPLFYRYIAKIVGNTALDNILRYKGDIKVEGQLEAPPLKFPYAGIGIHEFITNFDVIFKEFFDKKAKNNRTKEFHFVMENREKLFISYMPVINSKLRPAIVIDGEYSFDAINTLYNNIIGNCNLLKNLTSPEKISLNILPLCYKNQTLLNEIFNNIISSITNKEGYIRNTLFGNRLNLTSRMVITPLDGNHKIDDLSIPYATAVELMKPQIIRKLAIIKKISLVKATEIWADAAINFNNLVYKICKEIISKKNVGMICNRNPTINLGSVLFLRIVDIKKNMNDYTASIHNGILKLLGADYDGDVLNFILVFSDRFNELFDKFRPSNIMVDTDTGDFNKAFLPSKDTLLGLETLFN